VDSLSDRFSEVSTNGAESETEAQFSLDEDDFRPLGGDETEETIVGLAMGVGGGGEVGDEEGRDAAAEERAIVDEVAGEDVAEERQRQAQAAQWRERLAQAQQVDAMAERLDLMMCLVLDFIEENFQGGDESVQRAIFQSLLRVFSEAILRTYVNRFIIIGTLIGLFFREAILRTYVWGKFWGNFTSKIVCVPFCLLVVLLHLLLLVLTAAATTASITAFFLPLAATAVSCCCVFIRTQASFQVYPVPRLLQLRTTAQIRTPLRRPPPHASLPPQRRDRAQAKQRGIPRVLPLARALCRHAGTKRFLAGKVEIGWKGR
jgi:hypothetical protein